MGIETLLIVGALGAAAAAASGIFGGKDEAPQPAPLPEKPSAEEAAERAKEEELSKRARRMGQAKTILTGPQGVGEEAQVVRKTLLGE